MGSGFGNPRLCSIFGFVLVVRSTVSQLTVCSRALYKCSFWKQVSPRSIAVGRMKADLGSVKMAAHSRRVNLRHKRDISVDCDWRH